MDSEHVIFDKDRVIKLDSSGYSSQYTGERVQNMITAARELLLTFENNLVNVEDDHDIIMILGMFLKCLEKNGIMLSDILQEIKDQKIVFITKDGKEEVL